MYIIRDRNIYSVISYITNNKIHLIMYYNLGIRYFNLQNLINSEFIAIINP